MSDRDTLMNAFRPATEVEDPVRFAGRQKQVRTLTDALHTQGSVPLIYGHRGLGKSSLALQMRRIAMGEVELLSHLGAQSLRLETTSLYFTFYVTCTDAQKTTADLLQVLINAAESIEFAGDGNGGTANQLVDRTSRRKLTFKIVEIESTKRYKTESDRLSYQDLNLEEKLVQLCEILANVYGQRVLFIIDELDRMQSTNGLASFLKAASGPNLKFMLVGIASNISELLDDHQSLERRLVPVNVPLMTRAELRQIVRQAEKYLEEKRLSFKFTEDATNRPARVAAGFPWFVHVLGQASLMSVSDRAETFVHDVDAETFVHDVDIARAVVGVVDNQFAQQFADMYQNAVRDSLPREMTLRAFARWTQADIPTGEIYRVLRSREVGIGSPSVYRGHLCLPEYGRLLFTPAFQKRGLVRFRNEMFKAYVRLRPSIYEGADDRVNQVWERLHGA